MKLVSWNVNGLRACLSHGFAESFAALDADVFCLQETKMQPGQADFHPEGYEEYFNPAEKKGLLRHRLLLPGQAPVRDHGGGAGGP